MALSMLDDENKAIKDFTKTIELDDKYWPAYDQRGYVYRILGQYKNALNDYDKALELDPNNQEIINDRNNLLEDHPELKS
jgi:tetratricopeptide (TPR) repeat protein